MGWAGVYSWLLCHFPKSSMWHPSSGFQVWLRWVFKAHKGKKRRSWEERGGDPKCPLHLLCVVTPLPCPSMMVLSLYRLLKLSGGTSGWLLFTRAPCGEKVKSVRETNMIYEWYQWCCWVGLTAANSLQFYTWTFKNISFMSHQYRQNVLMY